MSKNLTLAEIIAKKKQGKMDKFEVAYYDSKVLGGRVEVRKIPLKRFYEIQDTGGDEEYLDSISMILFESMPMFKENTKEAMEVYDVSVASDLPLAVFEDNIGEMTEIVEMVNKFYGIEGDETVADKMEEEVKN